MNELGIILLLPFLVYIGIWVISSDDCYRHLWLNKLSEDLQSQVSQVIHLIRK